MAHRELEFQVNQMRSMIAAGAIALNYELMLEQHYRKWLQSGDTVIDVGAHIGRHLGPLIECIGPAGHAIAFEPLPFAFDVLKEKFSGARVVLRNAALAKEAGHTEFTFAQGTPEESGLKQRTYNLPEHANPTVINVDVETLDNHTESLNEVSFIKIDTEGGEIGVLQGGLRTLERFRPLVSVEYGFPAYSVYGHTKDTLYDLATQADYKLFDIFLNNLSDREDWHISCDGACWDFFMVPTERVGEFNRKVAGRS